MSTPILVWRYGLLPPVEGAKRVADQMWLAHRYRNKLIEIDRAIRAEREDFLSSSTPEMAALTGLLKDKEVELGQARDKLAKERSEARNKTAGDPTHAKNIVADLKRLRVERKLVLKHTLSIPSVQARLAELTERRKAAFRDARATCGVYWGTYLQVEAAVEQARQHVAPPRFRPWDGEGSVSVQLQNGLMCEEATSCTDARLRLSLVPEPVPGRAGKPLPRVMLRVGSTDRREPIFASWPLIMHRPLPEGGRIKWATVVRRRVAAHNLWSLHLTIEVAEVVPAQRNGSIAVNLRWARADEATIIAAEWCDGATEGDLVVDSDIVSMIRKADDLRSIRDKNFERAKTQLHDAKKRQPFPEEHGKCLEFLHAWRSAGKLASVVIWWRTNRFAGDEAIFPAMEAWRKQDKHLWEWEANARHKAIARRRDAYRVFAARAAEHYDTLVVEKLNIARLAELPPPEEDDDSHPNARSQRFAVSPSELRSSLIKAFRRRGLRIVEVPAGMSSAEMLGYFCERQGDEVATPTTRSLRFRRMRKIVEAAAAN